MCGIVGIYHSSHFVAPELYDSLIHLQHRGQDAAGILTATTRFHVKHGLGYVREIFTDQQIHSLPGRMGIAHVRYPTSGGYDMIDVQPLWIGSPRGIALAHNGNLTNYSELATEMTQEKFRHLNSSIDSEILLHVLAEELEKVSKKNDKNDFEQICLAIQSLFFRIKGSYSVVSLLMGKGLIVFRDPHGIRPLVIGERVQTKNKKDYIFASENTMFASLNFKLVGDVLPGEVIFVNESGELFRRQLIQEKFSPCIFEYVYFARPDAILDGMSVYTSRLKMGEKLAQHWQEKFPDCLPDVVIPAPFTSNTAAIAFARQLNVRYAEGLYKNPFVGRTFIMSNHTDRYRQVRYKLMAQETELKGKNVLILDDSIVRGNTSREIIRLVREVGALEIYFVSACAPVKFPCFYGIDMPSQKDLLAFGKTIQEIQNWLNVDKLLYQTETDLLSSVIQNPANFKNVCHACLNGCYVAGKISPTEKMV